MFTMEELLSKRNQQDAFLHFSAKKDGYDHEGIRLSEFPEYWELNHERIEEELYRCEYKPEFIREFEVILRVKSSNH